MIIFAAVIIAIPLFGIGIELGNLNKNMKK